MVHGHCGRVLGGFAWLRRQSTFASRACPVPTRGLCRKKLAYAAGAVRSPLLWGLRLALPPLAAEGADPLPRGIELENGCVGGPGTLLLVSGRDYMLETHVVPFA